MIGLLIKELFNRPLYLARVVLFSVISNSNSANKDQMNRFSSHQFYNFEQQVGPYQQFESSKIVEARHIKIGDLCIFDAQICEIIANVFQKPNRHGGSYSKLKAINLTTRQQVNEKIKPNEQMLVLNCHQLQFEVFSLDVQQDTFSLVMKDKCLRDYRLPENAKEKSALISIYQKNKESQMVIYCKCKIFMTQLKIVSFRVVDLFQQEKEELPNQEKQRQQIKIAQM